jgi:ABC-type antimicrobial peptide transport system permease subunit
MISLRTFVHYRLYSTINLLGLALSLTCVVIIARYVYSELTVDGFNSKLDRIFITTLEESINKGNPKFICISNHYKGINSVDISQHPGVERHSLFIYINKDHKLSADNQMYDVRLLAVDSVFLQILDYPVIAGAKNIRRPEDVFLTETFASKIFGKENPVGRTLSYPTINKTVTVAGIVRTPATHKSILSFDMIVGHELYRNWGWGAKSLILLYPGVDYREVNNRYGEFVEEPNLWTNGIRYQLLPYKDVYLNSHVEKYGIFPQGNIVYIFVISGIGILLLLIGLINYINIHSVVMIRRSKEFGLKKVFGAGSGRIFVQICVENLLLIFVSLALAFWLVASLNSFVENVFGVRQYPNLRFDVCLTLAILVLLPVLASFSPWLRYRYFSPLRSLRTVTTGRRSLFSRKFFLCFQYFMTIGMIVVSLFFVRQLNFMLDKDLGFRTQNIIEVPFRKGVNLSRDYIREKEEREKGISNVLKQKLNESALIERWSFGEFPTNKASYGGFKFTVAGKEMDCILFEADETWFKLFEVPLLEGRLWDNEMDDFRSYNLIVTESTLKQFGIADYREALMQPNHRIWWAPGRNEEMKTNPPYRIVGVVKDFQVTHLSQPLEPVAFYFDEAGIYSPVVASFAPERRQEVIAFMKNLHDELVGGDFAYSFIEDKVAAMYNEDKKIAMIGAVFTGMAIVISMLGLFGISLFDIRWRRKEIAIRKINGAQIIDIVRLLLKKYFALLTLAFAASIPVALFAIHKYLENFANKATIAWWLFAVALVVTLAVSLLTLLYQTYKAGNENPADVIKSDV